MLVSEAGEFGLIKMLVSELGVHYPPERNAATEGLQVGLGDDAVVTRRQTGSLVWTTDTMIEGVHFLPGKASWHDVGWRALAVNLSDIAAMGARPDLALITLMLPPSFEIENALQLYRGLREASKAFGVTIGGGDIVKAPYFGITVALSGWALSSSAGGAQVLRRDAARKGDVIAVSGTLGSSAAGLQLLLDGDDFAGLPQQRLREVHQRPQPRVQLGQEAVRAGLRCGMDVSDGLIQDLGHIARASNVSIRVDASRVPTSADLRSTFYVRTLGLALTGGEDYELILIGPQPVIESLMPGTPGVSGQTRASFDPPLTIIGEIVDNDAPRVAVVDESGREIPMPRGGWDHLAGA